MKPIDAFRIQSRKFWAYVQFISEVVGYSERRRQGDSRPKRMKRYSVQDLVDAVNQRGINPQELFHSPCQLTRLGQTVLNYLNTRAELLEEKVRPYLQDRNQAAQMFDFVCTQYPNHGITIQTNRQSKNNRRPLYLQNSVNILAWANAGKGIVCNPDPPQLLTISDERGLHHVLSRRLDGALMVGQNPVAIWECKEYYGTTTFGSRVADAVWETMLIGRELREVESECGIRVAHYLFIDDYYTWWELGSSYLCRIVDMLHMGYIDEVIVGKEVLTRWPAIVQHYSAEQSAVQR